jgi:hypothetical protein
LPCDDARLQPLARSANAASAHDHADNRLRIFMRAPNFKVADPSRAPD